MGAKLSSLWVAVAEGDATRSNSAATRLLPLYEESLPPPRSSELLKVTFSGSTAVGGALHEPFVHLYFKIQCATDQKHTRVRLTVHQADIGFKNHCTRNCFSRNQPCDSCRSPVFINQMTIEVCPKSWAPSDSDHVEMKPHFTPDEFQLQQSTNCGIQIPIWPRLWSLTYQTGNGICRRASTYELTALINDDSHNKPAICIWRWKLVRWANGKKLRFNRIKLGSIPPLGFMPSHVQIHRDTLQAEISWELPANVKLHEQKLEFDILLTLHSASIKKRYFLGYLLTEIEPVQHEKLLTFQ